MEVEYKRDMNHSYLVIKGENGQNVASYQIRMLLGNGVSSLLPCTIRGLNGEILFYYEITGRQSLFSFYEKQKIGSGDLQWILDGIISGLSQMEEYLLCPDDLVLRPEYIYLDLEQKKVLLCYLAGYQKNATEQFQSFTEYYLPKIDHTDTRAVSVGYGIYRLAMEEGIQAEQMKEMLYHYSGEEMTPVQKSGSQNEKETDFEEYQKKIEQEAIRREAMQAFFADGADEEEGAEGPVVWAAVLGVAAVAGGGLAACLLGYLPWQLALLLCAAAAAAAFSMLVIGKWSKRQKTEKEKTQEPGKEDSRESLWEEFQEARQQKQEGRTETGEEDQEDGLSSGETTVLYQTRQPLVSSLVSKIPGKYPTVFLEKEMTVIGKLPVAVDILLEAPTISRVHARITRKEERFYLSDLNSRNGTCVNGRLLQGEEEYELQNYDEISFAEIQYIFLK